MGGGGGVVQFIARVLRVIVCVLSFLFNPRISL